MRLGHDGIAGKLFTNTTAADPLPQHAVSGVAVSFCMFVCTTFTATFYVSGATAAVKAAFAQ